MTYTPDRSITHCGYCGSPYGQLREWPRDCPSCMETIWRNPLPVAVTLLPVDDDGTVRLLVARRTIEPSRGELALPGGYMEVGETWQQAAVRELREETVIDADDVDIALFDVMTGHDTVQIFGVLPTRTLADLPDSVATAESEGWSLLAAEHADQLAFPTQRAVASAFFAGLAA